MLARPITYTDFNGAEVTETFYFNISKPELIEMQVDVEGGMAAMLQKIVDSNNGREIIKTFKEIILTAYGVRSDDGRRFIKNDQLREEFSQMAAYHVLFMELSTNESAAANFIKGVMPADMAGEIEKAELAAKTGDKLAQTS